MPDPADDPYGYLENAADPATIAWTAAENLRFERMLEAVPGRPALAVRFEELTAIDGLGLPATRGGLTFFTARRGRQEQHLLYVRDAAGERALLDPAALDPSGLTSLDWWYPSARGRYVAFGLSQSGDERSTLFVLEVASGERLGEAIPDTRYCSLAWLPGEDGFYYTRYPPGGDYAVRLYRHTLGQPWAADPLVFGADRKDEELLEVALSQDGARLVVTVHDGWAHSEAYVAAGPAGAFEALAPGRDALYDAFPGDTKLYARTDDGAPRFRLYEIDYGRLDREAWREIVAEDAGTLDGFALARGALLLHYLVDARSELRLRRPDGRVETVPGFEGRSILGISAQEDSAEVDVLHASFLEPPNVLRLRLETDGAASAWPGVALPFDPRAYAVERVACTSRDGTRVPLTLIARADLPRDGTAPAVLYGYGGFNVSLVPAFTPSIVPWLDAGGVYAVANLRGGGEFGEAWHRAGMRERKQNVFDDFIAAATYLGTSGVADPGRIGIMGGSNGGLLVAAVAVQRPELVSAVVCLVPLTDMLRFARFSIARLWISEYGDPDDPHDAAFLRAYSPYHNVRAGVTYPAMLIAAAEADGRVDPMHAKKFGARLRGVSAPDAPIYIRVEADAGHGAGKPRHKRVAELAATWAFIGDRLQAGAGATVTRDAI